MKMLGDLAVRCSYGCCRVYGHKTGRGYRDERRHIKRSERNKWKAEIRLARASEVPTNKP